MKRIFLIVLDSFGIGGARDAAAFGDEGSDTLGSLMKTEGFRLDAMKKLGLLNIDGVSREGYPKYEAPIGAYARVEERSAGKDTTIGHWEIAGVYSPNPLPVFPDGFPKEIIDEFSRLTGKAVLCNKP